jgi:hypothetical protein
MNTKNQTLKRKKNETKNSLTCLKAKTFKLKIKKFGKKGKEKKKKDTVLHRRKGNRK